MLRTCFLVYRRCFLAFLVACALVPTLHGQSNESDLRARLMDKPLYLRGCWRNDSLNFDSAGQLKDTSDPISFTLSGFELQTLHLEQRMLVLEGRRVGLELRDNKQLRVPLNVGKPDHPKDESVRVVIAAPASGDYGPALDSVFANGLAELAPGLPSYWKAYAGKNFIPADSSTTANASTVPDTTPQDSGSTATKPRRIGGGVKPPKLVHMEEPSFSGAARALKYSGAVLIRLWVDSDGTPSHLSLVRAIGLGLDERALAAVQKYTFAPATMNDKPVLVELNVEVNFQIF